MPIKEFMIIDLNKFVLAFLSGSCIHNSREEKFKGETDNLRKELTSADEE